MAPKTDIRNVVHDYSNERGELVLEAFTTLTGQRAGHSAKISGS